MNSYPRLLASVLATLAWTVSGAGVATAQVVEPVATPLASEIASRRYEREEPPQSNVSSAMTTGLPLLAAGPFAFHPHLALRATRSEGVRVAPGSLATTTIAAVEAGVSVEAGEHWEADYTPTFLRYSSDAFKGRTEHRAYVRGRYTGVRWGGLVGANYADTSPVLVELARQVSQKTIGAIGQFSYALGQRTHVTWKGEQSYRRARSLDAAADFRESSWHGASTTGALGYRISRRIVASGLLTYGFADPSESPSMTFTRPEVQLEWDPLERLSLAAVAGSEHRRIHGTNGSDLDVPTYAMRAKYRPHATTAVSVAAQRGTAASYLADLTIKSESWQAAVEQRLLGMLFLTVKATEQKSRYVALRSNVTSLRSDRYRDLSLRLAVPLFARGVFAVSWNRARNTSSLAGYTFTAREYGAELRFRF